MATTDDNVTLVPALDARPETGPMQFGDDWPGVFIRGDNALFFSIALTQAAEKVADDWLLHSQVLGLARTLRSCWVGDTGWPPHFNTLVGEATSILNKWIARFETRKRELIALGKTEEQADEIASSEMRREIREV